MVRILIIVVVFSLTACKAKNNQVHSFFVAGHTYGNPMDKSHPEGLYKPFKDKFEFINNDKNIDLGFLLGDIVWTSKNPKYWDTALRDINTLEPDIYPVRGNHDGTLELFESRFGKSYKTFVHKNNLYVLLDANRDDWSISGEQLLFVRSEIEKYSMEVNNIFILTHQMIWWHKSIYPKPFPNSTYGKSPNSNYWSTIEPMLKQVNKPVYLFAGDVGAFSKEKRKAKRVIEYDYYNDGNLTYISTGMGGGVRDNFVIVDIEADGKVSFRLIHLNGDDTNSLGKLTDNFKSN
jgi:hypothetical protein